MDVDIMSHPIVVPESKASYWTGGVIEECLRQEAGCPHTVASLALLLIEKVRKSGQYELLDKIPETIAALLPEGPRQKYLELQSAPEIGPSIFSPEDN